MDNAYWTQDGIRYTALGDLDKARELRPVARYLFDNLDRYNTLPVAGNSITLEDGSSVRVRRQFGHKFAEMFVPPVPPGLLPGKRRKVMKNEISTGVYPAIELHADPWGSEAEMVGVVLCRGGGFNPPYDFVPKESLPYDLSWRPEPDLPEERIWWQYGHLPGKKRLLEDIVPLGKYYGSFEKDEYYPEHENIPEYLGSEITDDSFVCDILETTIGHLITNRPLFKDHWHITREVWGGFSYAFFKVLEDGHTLVPIQVNDDVYDHKYRGGGECDFWCSNGILYFPLKLTEDPDIDPIALANEYMARASVSKEARIEVQSELFEISMGYSADKPPMAGEYHYLYNGLRRFWARHSESILDTTHYAVAFTSVLETVVREYNTGDADDHNPTTIDYSQEETKVSVNGKTFHINDDYVGPGIFVKYFEIDDREIGLFFIPNYSYTTARYVAVDNGSCTITPVDEEILTYPGSVWARHKFSGTDYYSRGQFRLIRETVFSEDTTEENI